MEGNYTGDPLGSEVLLSHPKDANSSEGGQEYFLDMFVLVRPSSRPRELSAEVEYVRREGRNGVIVGTPHPYPVLIWLIKQRAPRNEGLQGNSLQPLLASRSISTRRSCTGEPHTSDSRVLSGLRWSSLKSPLLRPYVPFLCETKRRY